MRPQDPPTPTSTVWFVDNADHWIGLIDQHTPASYAKEYVDPNTRVKYSCKSRLELAAGIVAEVAQLNQLVWDRRVHMDGARGYYDNMWIWINPDHPDHTSDWEYAKTFAHEGMHGTFDLPKAEEEALIRGLIDHCFEEERKPPPPPPGSGGGGPEAPPEPPSISFSGITCDMVYNEGEESCWSISFDLEEAQFVSVDWRGCDDPTHQHPSTSWIWASPDANGTFTFEHCVQRNSGWECIESYP